MNAVGDRPQSTFFESELHLAADPLSFSVVGQRLSHEYLDLRSPVSGSTPGRVFMVHRRELFCGSENPKFPASGKYRMVESWNLKTNSRC